MALPTASELAHIEIQPPKFDLNELDTNDIRDGEVYMSNQNRFPLHAQPKLLPIAQLIDEYEVIVVDTKKSETNKKDGAEYVRTILPISAYIRKECLSDSNLLTKLTKESLSNLSENNEFKNNEDIHEYANVRRSQRCDCGQCCVNCLPTCCINRLRKSPIWLSAGKVGLQFLAECVLIIDSITDLRVAGELSNAKENLLFSGFSFFTHFCF